VGEEGREDPQGWGDRLVGRGHDEKASKQQGGRARKVNRGMGQPCPGAWHVCAGHNHSLQLDQNKIALLLSNLLDSEEVGLRGGV
jgi:hypothetical protein